MPSVQELENQIAELQNQRKTALRDDRNKDLSLVKEMCKKHGFTARMLKGYLADCLLYTSPSPRDSSPSRMPSSA